MNADDFPALSGRHDFRAANVGAKPGLTIQPVRIYVVSIP
jgi:hypothetical protein